jgi:hypothetical protein
MAIYLRERDGSLRQGRDPGDRRNQSYAENEAKRRGTTTRFVGSDGKEYSTNAKGEIGRVEVINGKEVSVTVSQPERDSQGLDAIDRQIQATKIQNEKVASDRAKQEMINVQVVRQSQLPYATGTVRADNVVPTGFNPFGKDDGLNYYFDLPGRMAREFESKGQMEGLKGNQASALLYGGKSLAFGVASGFVQIPKAVLNPIDTGKGLFGAGKAFVANPVGFTGEILSDAYRSPVSFIGEVGGGFVFGAAASKAARAGTNAYVKIGATEVPAAEVFSPQVLKQGKEFPLSSGIDDSLKQFNTRTPSGQIIVSTASPSPLKGTVAGPGRKGGLPVPLEDPVIFVTPKGQGSPAFLGLKQSTGYTLNPINALRPSIPTVTEFAVKSVDRQPQSALLKPGFYGSKEFLESQAGSQKAFITKRSELGQGSIPRQQFAASVDFESPIARTVVRDGTIMRKQTTIKAGDILREAGTTELEAGIPSGSVFAYNSKGFLSRIKGFDMYTTYEGRAVAIRRAELVAAKGQARVFPDSVKLISSQKVSKEYYSFTRSNPRLVSIPFRSPASSDFVSSSSGSYVFSPLKGSSSTIMDARGASSMVSGGSSRTIPGRITSRGVVSVPYYRPISSPNSGLSSGGGSGSSFGGSDGSSVIPDTSNPGSSVSPPGSSVSFGASGKSIAKGFSSIRIPEILSDVKLPSSRVVRKKKGFKVEVRRTGRFSIASPDVFSEEDALSFGREKVGTTAAASFRLVSFDSDPTKTFRQNRASQSDFYQSTREKGVFIEKASRRIKSAGEIREITFKGINSNRKKRGGLL